ncbi:cyanophycinase [Limnohabitans sp. T6-20]|uniref:cyanophycinase n=1 Tax=Limnohabitans sp. T6-20 TaxID=1100725 RepID=UPI000D3328F3|nr:cyanophycinase [Limnohabitans sp. T6-20]PUE12029.1 cyanophycinase [Limnohabitans sp. T6-20]
MNRRDVLARMTASAGVGLATLMGLPALAQRPKLSRLVIVGGAEDRLQDRIILRKYVDYCGGSAAKIRIITAASGDPEGVWQSYRNVFMALGVEDVQRLVLDDRNSAHSPQVQPEILQADGIFMSGGDQSRLMDILWDTPAYQSMHQAFHVNGCCIGGTSAGAAVMSRHMIAQGPAVLRPSKEAVDTDIGLGFLSQAVVDQHFSERRRLARLLSTLAMRPDLLGVGIDEDTALVIERGEAIEVIGKGSVTLVDPSQMQSNVGELGSLEQIEMLGVQLHLLPAGHRYSVKSVGQTPRAASLRQVIQRLVAAGPIRA